MIWRPKPYNWRRRWGYRPPSLERAPMSMPEIRRQADAYVTWLASARGWTIEEAQAYIGRQKQPKIAPAPMMIEPPLLPMAAE